MSLNPDLILYTCIAKDTTILAEYTSKDAYSDLAIKCLEKTPPFHSIFSHTVLGKTYMFHIVHPFVYFGIFDESLEKPECLLFLKNVQNAFIDMMDTCGSDTMKSHCFQREFSPVFHQLLGLDLEIDAVSSPESLKDCHSGSSDSVRRKKRLNKDELEEDKTDVYSDDDVSVSSGGKTQKGRYIWKKQVLIVLTMDLVICVGLFVIWLCVCNGFQCVTDH
uniref:phytolongin Phyl2.2-like n=1 Tax=Erigeron canadensis TaxID=72917 RepID=UPI001CB9D310|nr:phytolongin Phyl2.2-like [Erigeron canadensis]